MKKNPSRKHHYLPRHYLNGFTDNEGGFFVYDKSSDKIYSTSPNDAFFENDMNTVTFQDGSTSDFLESLYTKLENQSWGSLNRIRSSDQNTVIAPMDKMNLFLFISFLHWRLPSNVEFVDTLAEEFFRGENDFDYFHLKSQSGNTIPVEVIESVKNSLAFKKSAKLLVPLAPFFKNKKWFHDLEQWRFIRSGDDQVWYMVGDNPIITRGNLDHDPVNCLKEFIFPVSGKILLTNGNTHKGKMLHPEFTVKYNIAIIEKARRFVACQRKDFLEALIGLYKLGIQHGKKDNFIGELFDALLKDEHE